MPTTFTKESKPTTTYSKETAVDFLEKEDVTYLLLESGSKIIIRDGRTSTSYTKETKP